MVTTALRGTANRDSLGALVRVIAGDLDRTVEVVSGGSYRSHSDTRAHFGLGATVERIEIRWRPAGMCRAWDRCRRTGYLSVRQR